MGRQRKDKDLLGGIVAARLPDGEYADFQEAIAETGLTQSELIRNAVKAYLKKETQIVVVQKKMSEPRREMIFLAKKTSNNVNQIAHQINLAYAKGTVTEQLYVETLSALDMIMRHMKAAF